MIVGAVGVCLVVGEEADDVFLIGSVSAADGAVEGRTAVFTCGVDVGTVCDEGLDDGHVVRSHVQRRAARFRRLVDICARPQEQRHHSGRLHTDRQVKRLAFEVVGLPRIERRRRRRSEQELEHVWGPVEQGQPEHLVQQLLGLAQLGPQLVDGLDYKPVI